MEAKGNVYKRGSPSANQEWIGCFKKYELKKKNSNMSFDWMAVKIVFFIAISTKTRWLLCQKNPFITESLDLANLMFNLHA